MLVVSALFCFALFSSSYNIYICSAVLKCVLELHIAFPPKKIHPRTVIYETLLSGDKYL